ncbi:MoaD/ThiS family protein [Promicromonospora iranensis]|uniref:Molybdopterin synthase sulfur carrier subunit n=1 Tax=Promicromonospora iranensis TaxID=1105144 RepID=A0ABU2CQB8_9MICO|nr:MoaD/ThiS family protein [Promicromonospora iranensis]MDR7383531.1 molybdopterin converting factor small subunit [Promicromonospora iranensis]
MITVRYFAGAREAAGVATERLDRPTTVAALRDRLTAAHPGLAAVLPKCALLVAGARATSDEAEIPDDVTIDVLPPFAGG